MTKVKEEKLNKSVDGLPEGWRETTLGGGCGNFSWCIAVRKTRKSIKKAYFMGKISHNSVLVYYN